MVSLGGESIRSGGVSFGDSRVEQDREELLSHQPEQESHVVCEKPLVFKAIKTPFVVAIQIILTIFLAVEVFLLPWLEKRSNLNFKKFSAFSLIILSHAGLWFIFLFADRYFRYAHSVSRSRGYLDFYRATKELRRVPFAVISTGNTLMLIMVVLWHELCADSDNAAADFHHCKLGATYLKYRNINLQVLVSLEAVILLTVLVMYLVKTCQFNSKKQQPDVIEQDANSTAFAGSLEIGFRDENMTEDLIEKQAEMIRYLKEHNAQLGKRVLQLSSSTFT